MKNVERLKRITSLTGILIALVITTTIPVVYFSTAYSYQTEWLTTLADNAADDVSIVIYRYPDTWNYQIERIENILGRLSQQNKSHYSIRENLGDNIVETGPVYNGLTRSIEAKLTDGEKYVGSVIVTIDLQPLISGLMIMLLVGFTIATITYMVLRLLPFAALAKTTLSLVISREELRQEIEAKEQSLIEQQNISKKMHYQAMHDVLTGLPNRKQFYQELDERINFSDSAPFWVTIIDLDRFKEVNDALGHQVGDEVLKEISLRLKNAVTKNTLIARLGGDEYAMLTHSSSRQELEDMLDTIHSALRTHINIQNLHLAIYGSMGISQYPKHGTTQTELMRYADIAMYQAKKSGENWEHYNESISSATPNQLLLVADLHHAIETNQLEMHYQPKISLATGKTIGFEALARWQHPEKGLISPDVFILIAEQTNMIHDLTQWALNTALLQLCKWHKSHNPEWSMAVNISAKNLQDERLGSSVIKLLDIHNIAAHKLTLEITETSIMNDPEHSQIIVKKLADLGLKIAIDDFGTGYSSLAYLKRLDANEVKIDRSFVMSLLSDSDDRIIVESTIKLAHDLALNVVAEGVETAEVNEFLKAIGCEHAQGYFYCYPKSSNDLELWLESN